MLFCRAFARIAVGKKSKMKKPNKYVLYEDSVQDPESEAELFDRIFKEHRGKKAHTFREDFCGTFILSTEWVRRHKKNQAWGLDIDPVPLDFGFKNHFPKLNKDEQERLHILKKSVLDVRDPKVQILGASNFSWFIWKTRKDLLTYVRNAYESLTSDGVMICDIQGGFETVQPNKETRDQEMENGLEYTYVWEQKSFDPISHEATFFIHFKFPDGSMKRRAFRYDWRMWTIPEIRECMKEAGFKKTFVYWEGDDGEGGGNGEYNLVQKEENCEAWIAYVVGLK